MPRYSYKGKTYNIPDNRVSEFLTRNPSAKPLESGAPFMTSVGIGTNAAKSEGSTPRESNIPKPTGTTAAKNQLAEAYTPQSAGFTPMVAPTVPKIDTKLASPTELFATKSNKQVIGDTLRSDFDRHMADPAVQFEKALNVYRDSGQYERDKATDVGEQKLPPIAHEWLEKNTEKGVGYMSGTPKPNSPVTAANTDLVNRFIANSQEGRDYAAEYAEQVKQLDDQIAALEAKVADTAQNGPRTTRSQYTQTSSGQYGASGSWKDIEVPENEEDINAANTQLVELTKLRQAVEDGDRSALAQFGRELGRRAVPGVIDIATLGVSKPLVAAGVNRALQDEDNVLTKEATDILGQWQTLHANDRSIAQDIANGTYDSLAFMAQYALTGGAASAITKRTATAIAGKLGGKLAAQAIGKMGETVGGALVRTVLSPSTLAGAIELNTQNPGSFLNAYSQKFTQNLVEYISEGMGATIPGAKIFGGAKTRLGRALGKVGGYTGVQDVGTEFLEEQIATFGHSITQDGQGDWADFVDPRNQLVTLGSVAIMQLPNVTISAAGYAAGKARNVMQTRSIRKGYNRTSENMTLAFGRNAAEMIGGAINEQIDAEPETAIPSLVDVLTEDAAMNDRQKDAVVKYAMARAAMNGLNTAKTEEVEATAQSVAPLVEQNVNPQTGSIMTATIAGMDSPAQIVGGNIVRREDGTIDREQSDKQIYYTDAEGNRQVTSIEFVEEVNDDIPAADAVAQMTEMATAPIIARQENDEVRQYEVGEMARATVNGNTVVGQISGTDAVGNYIIEVETPNGMVQMPVEPRQIVNEDNIRGVENGSEILYMDENGNQVEGVAVMNPDLYLQGMIGLESGDIVPIADVVGLASEWRQTTATNNANTETVPQSAPVTGEIAPLGQTETQATAEQSGTQTAPTVSIETIVANAPKQKDGTVDYDALMETDPEAFAALYESEEGAEETRTELETVSGNIGENIASAQKQLNTADSINKRKAARAKIASLTDQKSRIDRIINERYATPAAESTNTAAGVEITTPGGTVVEAVEMPANARVENPLAEQTPAKPRKLTPRQEFVANTVPTNLYEAALLHMMGNNKLSIDNFVERTGYNRKDLGAANRVLTKGGKSFDTFESDFYSTYRPSEYEAGFESNLDEITQAVNDYIKDRGATDALKQRFGNADTWIDPDGEARAEYEAEMAEEDAVIENEIFSQEIGERAVELSTFAKELEIPETEIDASANLVSLIEQYQNGTTETEIHPRSGSTGESGDSVSTGQGERDTQETGTSGQRDGREQTGGSGVPDSDTRRNDAGGLGAQTLSTAEQQVVNDATAAFDAEVADAEARLRQRRADLTAARSRIGQAYTADNQTSLFGQGETATPSNLFNVPRDYSRENVEDILVPIQQDIDALAGELVALQSSRDSRIQAALDNFRSQPTILDAIAQAEAETDTNPTEAQKQAGNYKMGHVKVQGFDISIENPKGSVRSGVDENGRAWSQEMQNTYGYFGKTQSKDGDHIDVFLGDNPESGTLFVVDQVNPATGQFDEHKVMLGFDTLEDARDAYMSNYEDGWQGLGGITETDMETFRTWAQANGRRVKPFAEYKIIQNSDVDTTSPAYKQRVEFNRLKTAGDLRGVQRLYNLVVGMVRESRNNRMTDFASDFENLKGEIEEYARQVPEEDKTQIRDQINEEKEAVLARTKQRTEQYAERIKQSRGEAQQDTENKAQSTSSHFKPITERRFNQVVELLRRTGLAKEIVVASDNARFLEYLDRESTAAKQVVSEMEQIKTQAQADGIFMLAPNGQPTNLTETQWLQVRTRPFLDWFGDWINDPANSSKVVDENGEPRVVYHGSPTQFTEFDTRRIGENGQSDGPGFYFTDNAEFAEGYTTPQGSLFATFLNIRKPLSRNKKTITKAQARRILTELNRISVIKDEMDIEDGFLSDYADIREVGIKGAVEAAMVEYETSDSDIDFIGALSNLAGITETYQALQAVTKQNGVIVPKSQDESDTAGGPETHYVVMNPSDIKSATSNVGTFDPNNPDIRMMATSRGDVYGFLTPDGKVYIDGSRMNSNTPIHEFGHLWNSMIKEGNPELWARGSALIRESDYWRQINDNPAYRDLSDDRKVDEALAMAIGNKGEDVFNNQDVVAYAGVKGWLWQAWEWIKSKLGIARGTNIEDMTLGDFTDLAVGQLLGGKNLVNSIENSTFANENDSENGTGTETRMDNSRAMGGSAFRGALGESTVRGGVYRTVQAADTAGGDVSNLTAEQIEDLETRGIDPNFSVLKFREAIEENARKEGVWLEDDFLDDKELIHDHTQSGTAENDIYLNSDGITITKLNNLYTVGGAARDLNFAHLIDRINSHNELFPNVAYNIIGLMNNKEGRPSLVMEQRFVENARYATQEEIDNYLTSIGFKPVGSRNWATGQLSWSNGTHTLSDARPANVLRGNDGAMYFIDTIPNSTAYLNEEDAPSEADSTGGFNPEPESQLRRPDDGDIRFQSVGDVARANGSTMTEEMRNELDGELNNFVSRFREAWEDRHLAVKKFFDVLRKNGTVIPEYNDFYKQATHLAGKNDAQLNRYNKQFQQPLNEAISDLEKADFTYRDIENYVILKHGLERNEWMRRDAIRKYKEENPDASLTQLREFERGLPKDYSGITAVEAEILTPVGIFVSEFEEKAGQELIENLWTRIKGATNFALKKQLDGGLITKQLYDELTARYEFYVPLRGHDAETAENKWDYTPNMGTYFVAPLMKAKGRTSRSESPFAYIFSMAQSSINAANRNTLNQTILRLAMKDKTGLMSASKSWYVNAGYNAQGKPQYEVQSPEYSENPEQFVDGEVHPFVSDFIDQQRYINRLITLQDFVIRASAKGILLVPDSAIPDGMTIEDFADTWAVYNGVVAYTPKPGVPPPQQIISNAQQPGVTDMLSIQLKLLEDISGVQGALQGQTPTAGTPAALYMQQTQNSATALTEIFEAFKELREERDGKNLKLIQQFYTEPRYINITGGNPRQGNMVYNPDTVRNAEFDLSITESTATPAYRLVMNDFLMQLFTAQQISLEELLQNGAFPFADKLLQSIEARKQAAGDAQGMAGAMVPPDVQQELAKNTNPLVNQMLTNPLQQ